MYKPYKLVIFSVLNIACLLTTIFFYHKTNSKDQNLNLALKEQIEIKEKYLKKALRKMHDKPIKITNLTPDVIASIENNPEKELHWIYLESEITQNDIDKAFDIFPWIRQLKIQKNKDADLSNITKLKNLNKLHIKSDDEIDIMPLSKLTKLTDFTVSSETTMNIDALSSHKELANIKLNSGVSSLMFLKDTPNVKTLEIHGSNHTFKDYQPLASLKHLENLTLYLNNQISHDNLKVLKTLTSLKRFKMDLTHNVTNLEFLSKSSGLEELSLWSVDVSDLSPLAAAKNLRRINISSTKVTDISPLFNHKNLSNLQLSGDHAIPNEQIVRIKEILPKLSIRYWPK